MYDTVYIMVEYLIWLICHLRLEEPEWESFSTGIEGCNQEYTEHCSPFVTGSWLKSFQVSNKTGWWMAGSCVCWKFQCCWMLEIPWNSCHSIIAARWEKTTADSEGFRFWAMAQFPSLTKLSRRHLARKIQMLLRGILGLNEKCTCFSMGYTSHYLGDYQNPLGETLATHHQ